MTTAKASNSSCALLMACFLRINFKRHRAVAILRIRRCFKRISLRSDSRLKCRARSSISSCDIVLIDTYDSQGSKVERIYYKYMKNLIKDNLQVAMKFNGTMRYVDDLLTLNNSSFASKIPDIYPPELDLKKTYRISYYCILPRYTYNN